MNSLRGIINRTEPDIAEIQCIHSDEVLMTGRCRNGEWRFPEITRYCPYAPN